MRIPRSVRNVQRSHRPAEPAQDGGILGQRVGPAQPVQLQQVLGAAQEPVGGGQFLRVVAADVPAGRQCRQSGQRRGQAQRLVGAAVNKLQQLDGELDVPQPARAELELAPGLLGRQGLLDPAAHGLGVLDEVLAPRCLPDQWGERVRVRLAERHVARDRLGLEQRLELPGLRPALVVSPVAGQGTDQRAVAAFGAQVRVDGENAALRGGPGADTDHARGQPAGGGQRRRLVAVPDRFRDEDHVHIAGVVQLASAALAHGHHREPGMGWTPGAARTAPRPGPPREPPPRCRLAPRPPHPRSRPRSGLARRAAAAAAGTPRPARPWPPAAAGPGRPLAPGPLPARPGAGPRRPPAASPGAAPPGRAG